MLIWKIYMLEEFQWIFYVFIWVKEGEGALMHVHVREDIVSLSYRTDWMDIYKTW